MNPSVCAFCMLHRHQTFIEVITNIRVSAGMQKIPFYAFSFKDSYGERKRKFLEKNVENLNIEFIEKKIPIFLKEKDLFYNKKHLDYVRTSFPKSRVNYLHMINFRSDPSSIPYINDYDIAICFDDDSWFKEKIDFDFAAFQLNNLKIMATSHTHIDNIPKRRETKIGLFEATCEYCEEKRIIPKYDLLAKALARKDEELFYKLPWTQGDFSIFKMSIFQTKEWEDWISFIKNNGGIYTNRWADFEIWGIFAYIFYEDPILNLDLFPHTYTQRKDNQAIIHFHNNFFLKFLSIFKKLLRSYYEKYFNK